MKAFAGGQAAAYKMFETINRTPEIDAYSTTGRKLEDIRGDIEFRDVYFSYPTRPDEQIFKGFSLNIPSGMTIALVGQSGSGKSTVISLIERFYDPQLGDVLIDGVNLKEFQLRWIRSKIGLVSQEPVLFAASIKENIAYGKDNATDQEIRAAAELANAAKFIDKMPQVRMLFMQQVLHFSVMVIIYMYEHRSVVQIVMQHAMRSLLFLIFHRVSILRLVSMGHSFLVDRSKELPLQGLF